MGSEVPTEGGNDTNPYLKEEDEEVVEESYTQQYL